MKTMLSIAGSDSCGGAGIQADIKTVTANGVYAMTAITALTAQNTLGVIAVEEVSPSFLAKQIYAVFEDIRPNAVKIGMIPSAALMETIADCLIACRAENVVLDPVMVATAGSVLMNPNALSSLKERLFPLATLVTPNIPEAEILINGKIRNRDEMEWAAKKIGDAYGCAVLLKGGHRISDADDVLYRNGEIHWFFGRRIENSNTHGTGCTLSSAIAANLAKGYDLMASIRRAKDYISGALADGMALGKGSGPLNHAFDLKSGFI